MKFAALCIAVVGGLMVWRPVELMVGPWRRMGFREFAQRRKDQARTLEVVVMRAVGVCLVGVAVLILVLA